MISLFEKRTYLSKHIINNYGNYCFPETINHFGNTALTIAIQSNNLGIADLLIDKFGLKCDPSEILLSMDHNNNDWKSDSYTNNILENNEIVNYFLRNNILQNNIYNLLEKNNYINHKNSKLSDCICKYIIESGNLELFRKILTKLDIKSVKYFINSCSFETKIKTKILKIYNPDIHKSDDLEFIIKRILLSSYQKTEEQVAETTKMLHIILEKKINLVDFIASNYAIDIFYSYKNKAIIDYYLESSNNNYLGYIFYNSKDKNFLNKLMNKLIQRKTLLNEYRNKRDIIFTKLISNVDFIKYMDDLLINFPDYLTINDYKLLEKINDRKIFQNLSKNYDHEKDSEFLSITITKGFNDVNMSLISKIDVNEKFVTKYLNDILNSKNYEILKFVINKADEKSVKYITMGCYHRLKIKYDINLLKILNDFNKESIYEFIKDILKSQCENRYCEICYNDNDKTYLLSKCHHVLNIDENCLSKLRQCPICRKKKSRYTQVYIV